MKVNTILYTGSGSSSHTYGNVAALMKEFILSQFERDFFNHVHITTEHVSRERRKETIATDRELVRFIPPELTISPRFDELSNKDIFLKNTILTTNFGNVEQGMSRRQLNPLIRDKENNIELAFKMDRDRLVYDVNVYLPTAHMQLNVFKNLQHQMNWTSYITINTSLENMIPRSLISYLAQMNGWDVNNPNDVSLILRYLNTNTACYPITYKMKNSTANDEFFMYYPVQILMTANDLQRDDGSKIGEVDDVYPISFSLEVDFNMPVSYFLIGDTMKSYELQVNIGVEDKGSQEFIPIYTLHNAFGDMEGDGALKADNSIMFTADGGPEESLDLSAIFSRDMVQLINQNLAAGIDIDVFLKVRVAKGRELLTEGIDWKMNWQSMHLTLFNQKPDEQLRLITYVDKYYVNTKLKDILDGGICINDFSENDPLFE